MRVQIKVARIYRIIREERATQKENPEGLMRIMWKYLAVVQGNAHEAHPKDLGKNLLKGVEATAPGTHKRLRLVPIPTS